MLTIQCYMPVFNEADVLPHTLRHLYEQGCAVHVLDGWSTDGSWECIRSLWNGALTPNVTVERFPADGPDPIQNCTAILKRIEDLAAQSDADWILYSDADEWRRSNRPGETLNDAVVRADAAGYTAIDFRVFQFYCTTEPTWHALGRLDTPEEFFHYYDEADCISRIPNRKLWKNVGRVHLGGGGHELMFPGMVLYPRRMTMKHYPFRTPEQARRKIETRLARRRKEEHDRGWGVHYDQYAPDFPFVWEPEKLLYWKDTRTPLP